MGKAARTRPGADTELQTHGGKTLPVAIHHDSERLKFRGTFAARPALSIFEEQNDV